MLKRWRAEALYLAGTADLAQAAATESIDIFIRQNSERIELADAHRIRGLSLAQLGRLSEALQELAIAIAKYEANTSSPRARVESAREDVERVRRLAD